MFWVNHAVPVEATLIDEQGPTFTERTVATSGENLLPLAFGVAVTVAYLRRERLQAGLGRLGSTVMSALRASNAAHKIADCEARMEEFLKSERFKAPLHYGDARTALLEPQLPQNSACADCVLLTQPAPEPHERAA